MNFHDFRDNADVFSSGSVNFNWGDFGGRARCDVTVERIPALIDAWGQASGANPTGKMVISVTDPNREDVVARSVGSNQTVSFNVGNHGVLGTYEIRYSTPHSHKWNL